MKARISLCVLIVFLAQACTAAPTPAATFSPAASMPSPMLSPQASQIPATLTLEPSPMPARIFTVTTADDAGSGSLRQAMEEASAGDTILFDPATFPPEKPTVITLRSGLPALSKGGLTIDASNAGVVLDGSQAGGAWTAGIEIPSANNTLMGLEIANFSGPGVLLKENASGNLIGGDRSQGKGPLGQGNLIRNTSDGIGLQDASNNVIRGNLIGTGLNGTEKFGNLAPGIFFEGKSVGNTIGPGNVIANNGVSGLSGGVEIRSAAARGNRITANEIYANSAEAIRYNLNEIPDGFVPSPPVLLEFDLDKGTASGISCPNCMVELFTASEGIDRFAGSVQADDQGSFNLETGTAFVGEGLKATSFSEDGNTSVYSSPQSARSRHLAFQTLTVTGKKLLPEGIFGQGAFNKIGTMVYLGCQDEQSAGDFARMARRMGYDWMRINVDWFDWPEVLQTGEYSDFNISPCQDQAVDQLAREGVQLFHTITYWDPQIKVYPGYSRFRTQEEIDRYLEYTRFIVEHFKGKIQWYSILNEPNLSDGQRAVRVEDYINLVRQVIPVIRAADPQAKIAIGEVCPLNESGSLAYLKTLIASEVLPLVDGVVWHGSSGNSLDYQPDYYRSYPAWVDEIVATSQKNGFKGQFFATELHWRTAESAQPIDGMPWFYSNIVAGKYYARGMVLNLSKGAWILVGHENYESIPPVVTTITSLTKIMAGAQPAQIEVQFDHPSAELRSAGFSLPDGRRLLAVWRDVKAVDDDPGAEHTISLPDLQAAKVTGIDPLYAYRQELKFTSGADGLTLPGILVYDYPTFLLIE